MNKCCGIWKNLEFVRLYKKPFVDYKDITQVHGFAIKNCPACGSELTTDKEWCECKAQERCPDYQKGDLCMNCEKPIKSKPQVEQIPHQAQNQYLMENLRFTVNKIIESLGLDK